MAPFFVLPGILSLVRTDSYGMERCLDSSMRLEGGDALIQRWV